MADRKKKWKGIVRQAKPTVGCIANGRKRRRRRRRKRRRASSLFSLRVLQLVKPV